MWGCDEELRGLCRGVERIVPKGGRGKRLCRKAEKGETLFWSVATNARVVSRGQEGCAFFKFPTTTRPRMVVIEGILYFLLERNVVKDNVSFLYNFIFLLIHI